MFLLVFLIEVRIDVRLVSFIRIGQINRFYRMNRAQIDAMCRASPVLVSRRRQKARGFVAVAAKDRRV